MYIFIFSIFYNITTKNKLTPPLVARVDYNPNIINFFLKQVFDILMHLYRNIHYFTFLFNRVNFFRKPILVNVS